MMQRIADFMTRDVKTISPQESIQRAAQIMDELNISSLPVCDGQKLVGMITDRDITVRATAANALPEQTQVQQVMSCKLHWCFDDQPVDEVIEQMREVRIRRFPVIDHATKKMIGIVSLRELERQRSAVLDSTLDKLSTQSVPDRPQLNS